MRACANKRKEVNHIVNRIYKKPVGGDMTLPTTFIIPFESVVFVFGGERLTLNQQHDDFIKQSLIKTALAGELKVSLILMRDT